MRFNVGEAGVLCGTPDAERSSPPNRHTWKNRGMTERKPFDVNFETWIDRQIRMAQERGDFDNLPGAGKPLTGLGDPDDELWWVRSYLRREGLPTDALLPTPLQLRREIERLSDTVRDLPSEQAVRDAVAELNLRIVDWLRAPTGPQVPVGRVNAEHVVAQWRADRRTATRRTTAAGPTGQPTTAGTATTDETSPRRVRWWRRIVRRRRHTAEPNARS